MSIFYVICVDVVLVVTGEWGNASSVLPFLLNDGVRDLFFRVMFVGVVSRRWCTIEHIL